MRLTRNMLKYLYIYYLPSGLFVVVSWVGSNLPPPTIPLIEVFSHVRIFLTFFVQYIAFGSRADPSTIVVQIESGGKWCN